MKVLILNYEFPPLGGGAGNATYYLLKEFSKCADLEIDLVTSSTGKYAKKMFSDNIKIYYLDIGKSGDVHRQSNLNLIKYTGKAYKFCRRLKKKNNYDLVHAFFGIPCGYVAMKLKLPYIVSLRGSDVPFHNKRFYWLDKLCFRNLSIKIWRKAKLVIANSHDLRKSALQSAPRENIAVIYNGVNIKEFRPSSKFKTEFTILSTSRLTEGKGIEYLLDAFISFNKKYLNTRLILAGSGDLDTKLKQKTKEIGCEGKVDFLGAISHNKIASVYQEANVFVLPSFNEGMSNSLLEAMASGLAIITTNTGGAGELVNNNGFVVKKRSSADIRRCLEKLYLNKNLLVAYQKESRAKAQKMNWQQTAKAYHEIYKSKV